jgi:hypothetical protein
MEISFKFYSHFHEGNTGDECQDKVPCTRRSHLWITFTHGIIFVTVNITIQPSSSSEHVGQLSKAKIEYIPPKSFEDRNNKSDHRERVSTIKSSYHPLSYLIESLFLVGWVCVWATEAKVRKWCQTRRTSSGRSSSRCLELEDNWLLEWAGWGARLGLEFGDVLAAAVVLELDVFSANDE